MPFIGNQPALSYTSFAKQDFTTSATTSYTLDNPVANANELALFINFVRQEPTTAYSASGTSLTLTSATSATDDMYCVFLGKAVQTVNPPSGSVGTAQLASDAVTTAKILDANVTAAKLGTDAKNTPAFEATITTEQNPSDNTYTKINFDSEVFDTASAYDTTNKRFTVPSGQGGKYYIFGNSTLGSNSNTTVVSAFFSIYKNGSLYKPSYVDNRVNYNRYVHISIASVMELAVGDYVEMFGKIDVDSGTVEIRTAESNFGGYKIIE
jgi:hypothetical protein